MIADDLCIGRISVQIFIEDLPVWMYAVMVGYDGKASKGHSLKLPMLQLKSLEWKAKWQSSIEVKKHLVRQWPG